MIRAWRRRRADVGPALDETVFLGAQFDLKDAQIEGLRDALAEANKKLAEEGSARAREAAQFRYALAQAARLAGVDRYLLQGIERARRLAEEPTAVVTQDQLRRSRPAGPAPATEQYRRT